MMNKAKQVHLTDFGREIAESVMRRHMLTEWLLKDTLNVPWSETHLESHDIEHALSKNVEKRLQEHIKTVKTCPHGNPLPGNENYVQNWIPLSQFQQGEQGILRRIHEFGEEHAELLKFLEQHEFLPGVRFTVMDVLPFNQTMAIETEKGSITFGLVSVTYLFAEKI
jgi:DtxR family Mn-dependent transcriptional regulator